MDRTHLPAHQARHRVEVAETIHEQRAPFVEPDRATAPAGAPNVLVILLDDMGFGASSAFGGPCHMPVSEQLAADGLRLNRFHTTAICSPTRAALLTGRNHHSVGMGNLVDFASSAPGYDGRRGDDQATTAQILKHNGYATGAFGKWHQTPAWEITPAGPFDRWPTGEGFERFYGMNSGEGSQFTTTIYDGNAAIDPPGTEEDGYHFSEDIVDQAIHWTSTVRRATPDKPWFTYLSFGATHAPFHLPKAWRGRNRGKYAHGWNEQRRQTLARQKELGIVPADTELAPWTPGVQQWDDLSEIEQQSAQLLMEAYDSFAEHTDAQIGRFVDHLRDSGELDNTLIVYILGDNGAAAEGGLNGSLNEHLTFNGFVEDPQRVVDMADEIGGPETFPHYPVGWAVAMNAPFQYTKQVASHFGGTRNGAILHWPAGISGAGQVRDQFTHVIDVLPTLLDAIGLPEPEAVNGIAQQPLEGTSFIDVLRSPDAEDKHTTQYFEIFGSRAIYHDGWTAQAQHHVPWEVVAKVDSKPFSDDVWELYHVAEDFAQARNVAAEHPEKLAELQDLFRTEAHRYGVFPLDDRLHRAPLNGETGSPKLSSEQRVVLTPADRYVTGRGIPSFASTSFRITVDLEVDSEASNGVLVAHGGRPGGWSLHVVEGQVLYTHNRVGLDWTSVPSDAPLPAGRHTVDLLFHYDGGGFGLGGDVEFRVDGEPFGKGRLEATTPFTFSTNETTNVGIDRGSPVARDYAAGHGNPFSGTIHTVELVRGEDALQISDAERLRIELAIQ